MYDFLVVILALKILNHFFSSFFIPHLKIFEIIPGSLHHFIMLEGALIELTHIRTFYSVCKEFAYSLFLFIFELFFLYHLPWESCFEDNLSIFFGKLYFFLLELECKKVFWLLFLLLAESVAILHWLDLYILLFRVAFSLFLLIKLLSISILLCLRLFVLFFRLVDVHSF